MQDDEWRTIRVNMSQLDKDYEYYISLVEKDNKIVIVTREGKDFAALISPNEYDRLTDVIKS